MRELWRITQRRNKETGFHGEGLVVASERAGILRDLLGHWPRRLLLSELSGEMPAAKNKRRLGCNVGSCPGGRQKKVSRLKKYRMNAWL